jgi:hypothetical protein
MSAVWSPLLPLAMVGTDRHASALPAWPGDVGQLVAQVGSSGDSAASGALRVAAVLATCALAGAQGGEWTTPLPAGASHDSLLELPEGPIRAAVSWALQDGPLRLQHAVFTTLAQGGYRLPLNLLAQALDLGRRTVLFRPLLLSVLGERGLWLASHRDEWRYAAGVSAEEPDDARWNEGSFEQRRAFLQRERAADPQAARERLAQGLDELSAKERADLVAVLAEGLGPDDEPLLDKLLADRSREVRQAACVQLLRLPEAAHTQRAIGRLAPLLASERVLLRQQWKIDAPPAATPDWKADNLDPARPKYESLGERAWWLHQLVRQVPLAWWTQHTGLSAAELLRWAAGTDWTEALLRGWRDVLLAAPDTAWCEAFLDPWPATVLRDDPASVLALLSPALRERHWQRQLVDGSVAFHVMVPQMLHACRAGETLSLPLSVTLVDAICQRAGSRVLSDDHALRSVLLELCATLHADVLDRMARLPRHADETASFADTLHAVTHVIGVRQALFQLTTKLTPERMIPETP